MYFPLMFYGLITTQKEKQPKLNLSTNFRALKIAHKNS
jgi:hypothetical protein